MATDKISNRWDTAALVMAAPCVVASRPSFGSARAVTRATLPSGHGQGAIARVGVRLRLLRRGRGSESGWQSKPRDSQGAGREIGWQLGDGEVRSGGRSWPGHSEGGQRSVARLGASCGLRPADERACRQTLRGAGCNSDAMPAQRMASRADSAHSAVRCGAVQSSAVLGRHLGRHAVS